MPRSPESFGSGLPRVADFTPSSVKSAPIHPERRRAQTPTEQAQRLWDTYQDIKTAWVAFVRASRTKKDPNIELDTDSANIHETLSLTSEHPLSQKFHATEQFQTLHVKLRKLWSNPKVQAAWRQKMRESKEQWAGVNGSWEEYLQTHKQISELEAQYDLLQKERFLERGKRTRERRRTLTDDLVDVEMALTVERAIADQLFAGSPELAAKILASEMEERHREWQKDRFMMTRSRRAILEAVEDILNNRETLRLIVLEGEAGTGKTTFADALARWLTGENALRAQVRKRTKAARELLADQTLEAAGGSPTVHQIILNALTGKERPTDTTPRHQGRIAFIDEFNHMENDEAGEVATLLDGTRVGGTTRYSGFGANPEDTIQPHALVLAAQNPAGARFPDRTNFTPEVKRKLTIVPVEYPPQTPKDPELYESFLVVLKNADGNIVADKSELAPAWTEPQLRQDNTKQAQLKMGMTDGGALWRMARLLHESYENLATRPDRPRKNVLTDENPDALLSGRVLTPGDVFGWLEEYKTQAKKRVSIEHFCSGKLVDWLNSQFGSARDAGDRLLYIALAQKFNILAKDASGAIQALPNRPIEPAIILPKDIAQYSPRVPRSVIPPEVGGKPPPAPEFAKMLIDGTDEAGNQYNRIEVRIEEPDASRKGRYVRRGADEPVYGLVGTIRECESKRELVGMIVFQEEARPEKKIIVATLDTMELLRPQELVVRVNSTSNDIVNPFAEVFKENGIPGALAESKVEQLEIDLGKQLELCRLTYQNKGLQSWAQALPQSITEVTPSQDQMKRFEVYLREGRIPLFLPSAAVQLASLKEKLSADTLSAFQPDVLAKDADGNTVPYTANQANIWWDHWKILIGRSDPALVAGIPTSPWYICWIRPGQQPDEGTTTKTVVDQKVLFRERQGIFKRTHGISASLLDSIAPAEYLGLQVVFPETVKAFAQDHGVAVHTITPLDKDTYTRFINIPVSGGDVAVADWDADARGLRLFRDAAAFADPGGGVRLLVREKL